MSDAEKLRHLKNDCIINLCLNNSSSPLQWVVQSCFDLKTRPDIRVGTDTALAFEPEIKKIILQIQKNFQNVHDVNFTTRLRF
jgi:hypothetical protein